MHYFILAFPLDTDLACQVPARAPVNAALARMNKKKEILGTPTVPQIKHRFTL